MPEIINELEPMNPAIVSERLRSYQQCGRGSLIGYSRSARRAFIVPLTCKSWICPRCARTKAAIWKRAIIAGTPDRWITLTCDPRNFKSPKDAAAAMSRAFPKLWAKVVARFGPAAYIRIFEAHKSGWPHLHVVARSGFIAKAFLRHHWLKLGIGKVVFVNFLYNNEGAAVYVAKYLGKSCNHTAEQYPNVRLITKSRTWLPPDTAPPAQRTPPDTWWRRVPDNPVNVYEKMMRKGVELIDLDPWTLTVTLQLPPEPEDKATKRRRSGIQHYFPDWQL